MKKIFKKSKDKLYWRVVEKNPYIRHEYENVVNNNKKTHKNLRILFWLFLMWLNIKYRIFRFKPKTEALPNPAQQLRKSVIPPMSSDSEKSNISSSKNSSYKIESQTISPPLPIHYAKSISKSYDYVAFSALY